MRDPVTFEWLAIEAYPLDIALCVSRCPLDDESVGAVPGRVEPDCDPIKGGCRQGILRYAGHIGVEAHHGEDRPGGHGAGIVISRNPVRSRVEVLSQQFAHQLLRPPLFAAEVGEEEGIGTTRGYRITGGSDRYLNSTYR